MKVIALGLIFFTIAIIVQPSIGGLCSCGRNDKTIKPKLSDKNTNSTIKLIADLLQKCIKSGNGISRPLGIKHASDLYRTSEDFQILCTEIYSVMKDKKKPKSKKFDPDKAYLAVDRAVTQTFQLFESDLDYEWRNIHPKPQAELDIITKLREINEKEAFPFLILVESTVERIGLRDLVTRFEFDE